MSCSNWRDTDIRKLLTIMGEKVMQLHLMKTGKAGTIYEKVAEELFLRCLVSKIKHMLSFLHLLFYPTLRCKLILA